MTRNLLAGMVVIAVLVMPAATALAAFSYDDAVDMQAAGMGDSEDCDRADAGWQAYEAARVRTMPPPLTADQRATQERFRIMLLGK